MLQEFLLLAYAMDDVRLEQQKTRFHITFLYLHYNIFPSSMTTNRAVDISKLYETTVCVHTHI